MTREERILEKLKELGAQPKRSLGQNFLISDHVVERILAAVKSEPFTEMVEVGPGLGALTDDLLTLNRPLVLLELDRSFAESWRLRAQGGELPLRVIEGDALQLNWQELGLPEGSLFVSNLPYQISSSLVIERSIWPAGITRMILMFQKEVAQRIAAKASSKEYGLLTVIAQTFWETQTVCDAGPGCFFPPPNVASRVLMFKRRKTDWLKEPGADAEGFLKFAKAAFSQRRKLLSRNLQNAYFQSGSEALPEIEAILVSLGLLKTARAEELDPATFVRLYLSVVEAKKGTGKGVWEKKDGIKIISENRKARHDFIITDTYEAGIELRGSEVKSLRAGDMNLKDSYVDFTDGEAYLRNAYISIYRASSYMNHEPERRRKLLLNRTELAKIEKAVEEKGLTCVPLKVYFKGGWAKVEVGIAKGKKVGDKRESAKARDMDREIASAKRRSR